MRINAKVVDGKLQASPEDLLKVKKSLGLNPGDELPELGGGLEDAILSGREIKLTLRQGQSPGDVLVLTAAVRDLKKKFPNLQITMETTAPAIWENNPHVEAFCDYKSTKKKGNTHLDTLVDLSDDKEGEGIAWKVGYPLVHRANSAAKHFIHGFKEDLETKLGISFDITAFKCDVHLSDEEKTWTNQVNETFNYSGKFWIINSGSKNDFPLKQWSRVRWQEVVDSLLGKIQFVQVGEEGHNHEPLKRVFDLVGKTDMRQLIRLCYHAEGTVCHVTMLNHLMSVWEKPCVVIAGGRESAAWEAYNETTYLDTIGNLPCCKSGGCWKSKAEECPRMEGEYPKCMNMITAADVTRAIEKYYIGGRLSW